MDPATSTTGDAPAVRWRPLPAIDRRVIGVLIEKAKTTPDAYPLSASALRSGMSQKNNRYPVADYETDDIDESLERLRALGAVTEVQGGGRVSRFRHHMYDWLGVDKVELAVMAELLLRGAQTEGELRGRAARMEPIADLAALRPTLDSLEAKRLIVSLTPKGRGHVLTHALYEPRELEKLRAEFGRQAQAIPPAVREHAATSHAAASHDSQRAAPATAPARASEAARSADTAAWPGADNGFDASALMRQQEQMTELRSELAEVRAEVGVLRRELEQLLAQLR